MQKKYLLAILGTLFLMAIFFFKDHSENSVSTTEFSEALGTKAASKSPLDESKIVEKQAAESKSLKDRATQVVNEAQIAEIQVRFSNHLKQMGICLGIQVSGEAEKVSPTLENLTAGLRPALGEAVVTMDDWSQQDLKYADGSLKRVRTETEYPDNANPIRRVQLYKINDQGMPEMQTLNPNQANDPSDEYLLSIKGDGEEVISEKGSRSYYQEGEELVLVEKSGKVQSFSLSRGEKTFSCTEIDATTSNCQCL